MINLKEMFGDRFKIGHDPAAVTFAERNDPWMMTLLCQGKVVIYPVSADRLAVEIDYRLPLARKVSAIDGAKVTQQGDHEVTITFPLAVFEQVAALVKPRRKRRLTTEHNAALQAKAVRFTAKPVQAQRVPQLFLSAATLSAATFESRRLS